MFANVVTTRYKDGKNLEEAITKVREIAQEAKRLPGARSITFVRTGDAETVHVAVYDTQENATAAREKMFPRFKETVGPHASGDPQVRSGEILLHV